MTCGWFRSPAWDESAQADIEVRLSRARAHNCQQYPRIKALGLRDHGHIEASKGLFRRVIACAVIGAPDDKYGGRVHALVVLVPETGATLDEMQQLCRRQIAGAKARHSAEFASMLPTSGGGKVVKPALRPERQSR